MRRESAMGVEETCTPLSPQGLAQLQYTAVTQKRTHGLIHHSNTGEEKRKKEVASRVRLLRNLHGL